MPWLNALVVCPVPRGCLFASPVPGYLSPGNDPEELEAKAVALFKPYRAALLPLFRRYVGLSVSAASGARGASFEQLKHARVNLAQASWLRMCRDFRLVSSLLSSTDATAVFHRCNLRRDKGVVRALLGYAEFLAALRVIALHGFPQADGADGAQHGAGAGAADATVAAVPPAVAREDGEGNGQERGPETASPPVAGPVFSLPPGTKPAVESTPGNLEAADTAKEAASVKALCKYVSIPADCVCCCVCGRIHLDIATTQTHARCVEGSVRSRQAVLARQPRGVGGRHRREASPSCPCSCCAYRLRPAGVHVCGTLRFDALVLLPRARPFTSTWAGNGGARHRSLRSGGRPLVASRHGSRIRGGKVCAQAAAWS